MKNSIAIAVPGINSAIGIITFLFIAVFALLGVARLNPPSAVPASAPLTEFSSGRAMDHLKVIGQKPHAMGMPEHTAVRDYIVKELNRIDARVEVQQTTSVNARGRAPFPAGTVYNILARLDGTANTGAIMLTGHYDSVLAGPGANDDGAAVATMLETLRAVKAGPPLRNDLILLFTDGEEADLLGSRAFVEEHPWAKDVGLVLNFEARGNSGSSLMFETSNENGWLIQEFARAAPHPFASSLFYNVYQYLPNDTDFTMFKEAGLSGFNFAYIDGLTYYHSPLDRFENVSERSLQHHGSYALALVRHFGDLSLDNTRSPDVVYFDLLSAILVRYPLILVIPLAVLAAILFVGVVALGFRNRHLTAWGVVLGAFAFLLNLALAGLVAIPLLILAALTQREFIYYGDIYSRKLYLVALVALVVALTSALQIGFRARMRVQNLAVGALLWWLVLAVLTAIVLPGSSYLFVWPLLFSLIGLGVVFRSHDQEHALTRHVIALLLCTIPAVILFAPLIYMVFITLTIRLGAIVAVVTALLLGLLIPQLGLMALSRKWLLPTAAALVGIGCLAAAVLTSRPTAERPRPDNVLYGLNADSGSALWASTAVGGVPPIDDWTAQFFSAGSQQGPLAAFFPLSPNAFIHSQAPAVALAAPQAELLDDTTTGDVRMLRLRITSPRQAPIVWIYADSKTRVLRAAVEGKGIAANDPPVVAGAGAEWGLIYWALPVGGVELRLEVPASQPVTIRVVDRTDGLPTLPGLSLRPRADTLAPSPSLGTARFSNATLVSKSFTF